MAENRANNALAVLGKVNNTQFEDVIHTGTPRPAQRGRCYNFTGHGIEEIHIPATNNVVTYATALDSNGNIIDDVAALFSVDKYIVTYDKAIFNIKLWTKATPPTNEEISQFYHNDFSDLFTWLKADEGSGSIAYKAWSGGVNGTIVDAITVPYEQDMNSIHQYQDVFSWHNEVGYSLKKFYDLRAENYYADDAPPVYLHQVSQFALQNGLGVLYTSRIRKRVPSLGAGAEWGVAYIPPVVGDNKTILTPYPEGIYLANDSYGASGLSIVKGSTDPNFPNARFEFDAEFFGGQMNLVVRNLIDFLKPLNDKVTEIVSTAGLANNYSNTIYNWYTTTATQAEKDALDATIPNDMDGSKVNYERFYNDLVGGHKGNKISNIANEAIKYTHPTPITGKFTLLQGKIHNNNTSHFATLYSGLEFSIASIAMDYNNLGDENNYMLLKDARLFTLDKVLVPRDESVVLPPFKDVKGGLLDNIGHVPSNFDWVNSGYFDGSTGSSYISTDLIPTETQLLDFKIQFFTFLDIGITTNINCRGPRGFDASISRNLSRIVTQFTLYGVLTFNFELLSIPNPDGFHKVDLSVKYNGTDWDILWTVDDIYTNANTNNTTNTVSGTVGRITINTNLDSTGNVISTRASKIFNLRIWFSEILTINLPMCEPITDPANHIYFNKCGNDNHATLINGLIANYGRQNVFHDLMVNGFTKRLARKNENTEFLTYGGTIDQSNYIKTGLTPWSFSAAPDYRAVSDTDTVKGYAIELHNSAQSGHNMYKNQDYEVASYRIEWRVKNINVTSGQYSVLGFGGNSTYDFDGTNWTTDFKIFNNSTVRTLAVFVRAITSDGQPNGESFLIDYFRIQRVDTEVFVPALSDNSGNDAEGYPLSHPQDGKTLLDCGTEIQAPRTPDFVQSDINDNILFDINGTPFPQSFASIQGVNDNKFFADVNQKSNGIIRNIKFHKAPLSRNQLDTEKRTTNN